MGAVVFPAAGGGVTQKVTEFTSSGTWTAPTGVTAVEVFAVGGGGGGGGIIAPGDNSTAIAAGGGGGGGCIKKIIPVTPGTSYTITIGAGGAAGTATSTTSLSAAGNGGSTTFGSLVTAYGGTGGLGWDYINTGNVTYNAPTFGPGAGGTAYGYQSGSLIGHVSGGGGGGASTNRLRENYSFSSNSYAQLPFSNTSNPFVNSASFTSAIHKSLQGLPGRTGMAVNSSSSSVMYVLVNSMGCYGVDGYGGGGGGGVAVNGSTTDISVNAPFATLGSDGGGAGGLTLNTTSAQAVAGSAATANTGGGGGGAVVKGNDGTIRAANGGAGAAGYMKLVYWS